MALIFVFSETSVSHLDGDIIFLLDSSTSVQNRDYYNEKLFVKSLAKFLNVGSGHSRAGLVTYGSQAFRIVHFGESKTLKDFGTAVDNAGKAGGPRRIDVALSMASTMFYDARNNVPKVRL